MSQENSQQFIQEDEINLRELWKTLMKRKMLILVITGLVTVAAVAYALIAQPIYGVKSNIEIGYIGQTINKETGVRTKYLVSSAESLVKILNIVFNTKDKLKTEDDFLSKISSISTNKKLLEFIELKTEAISNEEALKKNKEVVGYIQELHQPEIDQYLANTKNSIENTRRAIVNIDTFEIKNVQEQIRLLKTQKTVQIDEKIKFLQEVKLKSIQAKLEFYTKKLNEYIKAIDKLHKKKQVSTDAEFIGSMQMINYQNLILSSQDKIEDLKLEKQKIETVTIINLKREKENILNETIRKLQHQIDVDLANKKIQLAEQIEKLEYSMSEQNVQNSKVIGDYVIKDYPVKPKKKLIVVVAFITGLMLSVFLAFFLEFIQAGRKEEK